MYMIKHQVNSTTIHPYLASQLRTECNEWRRQLDYMLQENTNQKNLLAEVIQTNTIEVTEHLEEAEQFQNQFLHLDAALRLMRFDINQHDKDVNREYPLDENFKEEILTRQNTLRHEMVAIDSEFQFIRYNFYTYLATFA
jgi:hypothetical protein